MKLIIDERLEAKCFTCQRCDCGKKDHDFLVVTVDFKNDIICIYFDELEEKYDNQVNHNKLYTVGVNEFVNLSYLLKNNKKKYYRIDSEDGFSYFIKGDLYRRDLRYEDIIYEFEKWFNNVIGVRYTDQAFNYKKFKTTFMKNPFRYIPNSKKKLKKYETWVNRYYDMKLRLMDCLLD